MDVKTDAQGKTYSILIFYLFFKIHTTKVDLSSIVEKDLNLFVVKELPMLKFATCTSQCLENISFKEIQNVFMKMTPKMKSLDLYQRKAR